MPLIFFNIKNFITSKKIITFALEKFNIHYLYNMEKFNIQKIIEYYSPNTEELGRVLFPHIKYPKQAFDRVLKGEANLDSAQIELLANYLGVLVADLFSVDDWKGEWDNKLRCLTFVKGLYRVNLNYGGSFITVYKDGKMVHQEIKSNADGMSLTDFIQYINNLIK